ncbi:MAG: DUF4292 domain-containing protein [Ignavibacteriales bacterium]|nr:DUF4292 domain-containing protein [Ignavibacteriales bacterium]
MKLRYLLLIVSIILPALYFAGCAASTQKDEYIEKLSSERLINKLEANRRKVKSMEATGTIHVTTKDFDNSASFKIIVQKPDSIYLSIFGPFGIDLAQILVTKTDYIFLEALNNTAYTGKINNDILKEIFKINIPFNELIDAFTGSVNLSERLYKEPTFFDIVQDKYILTYIDSVAGTQARYSVDVKDLSIISSKLETMFGKPLLEGTYTNFQLVEALSIPKNISLQRKTQKESVEIEYKSVQINKKSSYIDFKLPEDATVIKW